MADNNPTAPAAPAPRPYLPAPSAARELLNSVVPEARLDDHANTLAKRGMPVETIRQAIGNEQWQPDQRSKDQVAHDRLHGVESFSSPNMYRTPLPATVAAEPEDAAAFLTQATSLVADLQFPPEAGRSFISNAARASAELASSADAAAVLERWQATLDKTFGQAAINAASDQIVAMLRDLAGGNELIETFKRTGVLRNPVLFAALKHRAASYALWKSTRPK